jgi:hypothetical protein
MQKSFATMKVSSPGVTFSSEMLAMQAASVGAGVIVLVANLAAVGWFGMWMGLTNRKPSIAILKIICIVWVLPGIAFYFALGILMMTFTFAGGPVWLGMASYAVLHLIKDAFFILWARRRLFGKFREVAAFGGVLKRPRRLSPPPVLQPAGHFE